MQSEYKTGNKKLDEKIDKALGKIGIKLAPNAKAELFNEISGKNKFGVAAKGDRTDVDGFVFASKAEMERWHELLLLQKAGQIANLQRQVPFILQEGFVSKQKEWGEIKPIIYIADFTYTNISYMTGYEGREIVEDSKTGMLTPDYRLKRKIFLYKFYTHAFFEV